MTDSTEMTIRCEEALRLLATYLDGELASHQHGEVERHLEACRSCFSRAEFERGLRVRLAGLGQRQPDPAFAARLNALIRQFPRAGPNPPAE